MPLLDVQAPGRGGLRLVFDGGAVTLRVRDGAAEASWSCDVGLLKPGREHHVVVTVDGGPGIVTWVVDGVLCDGGSQRVRGWQRFRRRGEQQSLLGRVARSASGQAAARADVVGGLRIYGRALRTSEAISNYRSGR